MELRMRWTMQVCTIVGGNTAAIASGKSLQAIDDGDQNVLDATGSEFVHHAQPEFGAFRGLDPKTQDVLGPFRRDAQRDIVGLVANEPLVADFDPQRVEENQGIDPVPAAGSAIRPLSPEPRRSPSK